MGLCSSGPKRNPNAIDLSHFDIGITLGRGGFGKVHAVRHYLQPKDGPWVALKRMSKTQIINEQSLDLIWSERNIMMAIEQSGSKFLCGLLHAFQNDAEVFIITQFMRGGDFTFQQGQKSGRKFSEDEVRFYMAEMVCAMEALHGLGFLYRDLKPENLLLDIRGHIRFSDFGLSVKLDEGKKMKCVRAGTPGYMAPELVRGEDYGFHVDIYSLGATMFELLHGQLPVPPGRLAKLTREEAQDKSLFAFKTSTKLSPDCADLVKRMLNVDPENRIGCGEAGLQEIKEHKFFSSIDWKLAIEQKLTPPIIPSSERPNVDMLAEANDQLLDSRPQAIAADQQHLFEGWDYKTEISPSQQAN